MNELLANCSWLWPLAWQSTVILAAGLGTSVLLRDRPVRAHQALLLALAAAVLLPAMTLTVRRHHWGLLKPNATVVHREYRPFIGAGESPAPRQTSDRVAGVEPSTRASTTNTSVAPETATIPWGLLAQVLWLTASSALLIRLLMRFWWGLRLVRQSQPVISDEIAGAIEKARRELQVKADVLVRSNRRVHSPVIWCWKSQPLLLVPNRHDVTDSIDWDSVACHELAHWKRRDHLTGLLAELLICAMPWQLLFWATRHRLVALSEETCDDWVLASGQIPTRYARTLLSLTPQGQSVWVPAVVASKNGLGGRVRRIISDRCANPHADRRWTLAASLLAAAIAGGVALAQVGRTDAVNIAKTDLGHGAVIEQLASATTIEGTVVDPNGEPVDGQGICIAALPSTYYAVEPDSQGRFQLPWSPAFNSDNGVSYLMATRNTVTEPNYAALVEIHNPASPVTVYLEPAIEITGRAVDASDKPVSDASVTLYLTEQFACEAPIAVTETRQSGEFSIQAAPTGRAYVLGFRVPGRKELRVGVDTPDKNQKIVDIGRIVLNTPESTGSQDDLDIELKVPFEQVYSLGEGEVLRLVKPPFPPAREACFVEEGAFADVMQICPYLSFTQHVDSSGAATFGVGYAGSSLPNAKAVLNWVLGIPDYDVSIPDDLGTVVFPRGDYVIRGTASVQEKLQALEQLLQAELHRSIHFEKRTVERNTIVVTGRYAFTPLPGKDPNYLYVFAQDTTDMDSDEVGSLAELFERIADNIDIPFENRTGPGGAPTIKYMFDCNLLTTERREPVDLATELPALLETLARQTGLTFTVEKLPREVWFAVENTAD